MGASQVGAFKDRTYPGALRLLEGPVMQRVSHPQSIDTNRNDLQMLIDSGPPQLLARLSERCRPQSILN